MSGPDVSSPDGVLPWHRREFERAWNSHPEHALLAELAGECDTDGNLAWHTVGELDPKDRWVRYIFRPIDPLDARAPIVIYGWPGPDEVPRP